MQLQVALDRIELDAAIDITTKVAPHADWIEVGTSLIKRFGMRSVSEVVASAGDTPVLADLKTADDAATEFGMAFDHGARAATVLAAAADATIDRCVQLTNDAGGETVLDLLEVSSQRRDDLLERLPGGVVFAAHVGKDAQAAGQDIESTLGSWVRGRSVAVAGGLAAADSARLRTSHPHLRVIIGSAITQASDPAETARKTSNEVRGEHQ
ncbi:orotidine 5'-phosphate decarboxylase / HUMPS family protein [Parasphingorhabdus pacifica]